MSAGRRWPPLRHLGLAAFLLGLLVFLGAAGQADYRIDSGVVEALVRSGSVRPEHRDALFAELALRAGHDHDSLFALLRDADAAIDGANARLDESQRIWDYDRGQYRFALARAAAHGPVTDHVAGFFLAGIVLAAVGGLLFALPGLRGPAGIRNDGAWFSSVTARGAAGIALGAGLVTLYVLLYFRPEYIVNLIRLADPVSFLLRGREADRWFFYGMLYTLAVVVMGVRMLIRYRHTAYQRLRTLSVMFFQVGFAFLIPAILEALGRPGYDLKNAWPLDYSFFYGYRLDAYTSGGAFGWFALLWGLALSLILVPLFAWLFGKRWYCSWVCGCGGLAETLGDPFRHLSDKRLGAWRVERFMVHGVLVLAVALTGVVLVNRASGGALLGDLTWRAQQWYGFLIGSIFAGVVGTGFYPLMGNRVWCRFGCPLAAILGIVQRYKSRFRITTNGGQCISCGNCSTYCEMGIDVRSYAQRGLNVVRASCVGCGVCASVCPRGVLRLETGPENTR